MDAFGVAEIGQHGIGLRAGCEAASDVIARQYARAANRGGIESVLGYARRDTLAGYAARHRGGAHLLDYVVPRGVGAETQSCVLSLVKWRTVRP